MGGACGTHKVVAKNAYSVFVGNPEGKRPLARLTCRWDYNIKMDLKRDWLIERGLDLSGSGWGQLADS